MEPEASLPHSQVPAACLYREPAQSSPYPHFLKILPSTSESPVEKIGWIEHVINEEVLLRVKEQRNTLHEISKWNAN
jgi:hypothetical protein